LRAGRESAAIETHGGVPAEARATQIYST